MADTVANKKSFNEKFNNFKTKTKTTFNNAKTKVKNTYNSAKTKVTDYNSAVKQAYKVGWNAGYQAQKQIPNKFGVSVIATNGFHNGFKTARKTQKYAGR